MIAITNQIIIQNATNKTLSSAFCNTIEKSLDEYASQNHTINIRHT